LSCTSKKCIMEQKGLPEIKSSILITGGKGGVGKTTIAINLAFALSRLGYKTGLLDIDIHGPNAAGMLGMNKLAIMSEGEALLPLQNIYGLKMISMSCLSNEGNAVAWRGPMKHKAIGQLIKDTFWGQLDYFIVDCPPGTGDELMSASIMLSGSRAILVSAPQKASVEDVSRTFDFLKKTNVPVLGLIENMSGGVFGSGRAEEFARSAKIDFLGSIGLSEGIASSGDASLPFLVQDSKTSRGFLDIVDKIVIKT
jgi:ATP-binding protein involved in chromosome partitioning